MGRAFCPPCVLSFMLQSRLNRLVNGMAALLISGFYGMRAGMLPGVMVGFICGCFSVVLLPVGAIVGLIAGSILGFPIAVLGASFGNRSGWSFVAAIIPCAAICVGFRCLGFTLLDGTAIAIMFIATVGGGVSGYKVGRRLQNDEDDFYQRWSDCLDVHGLYELTLAERMVSLLLLCGTIWGAYLIGAALIVQCR